MGDSVCTICPFSSEPGFGCTVFDCRSHNLVSDLLQDLPLLEKVSSPVPSLILPQTLQKHTVHLQLLLKV